ncbi:MAG: TonB family protein [Candidatus Omnitrophica bacterium]|nr:TonB family protein [Candidatus Omnitrophota bacterium]
MKKALSIFFISALIFFAASGAKLFSLESLSNMSDGQEIRMVLGNVVRFKIDGITKIVISNPKIADVVNVNLNELTIEPKAVGTTEFVYIDAKGEHRLFIRVLQRDLEALKRGVDAVIQATDVQGVSSQINYEAQKVYLTGEILNEVDRKRILTALGPLSTDVVDLMVTEEQKIPIEVDVEAVEMDKNDVDDIGVKWTLEPFATIQETPFSGAPVNMKSLGTRLGQGLKVGYTNRTAGIKADINLLVQRGKAKILSRPKLVCLSGKEAQFMVGGEIPVVTVTVNGGGGSSGSTTPNVEYKKYGVSLNIKPRIRESGEIELVVNTEVTDIDKTRSISTTTVVAPAFTTRTAQTELYLKDNETVFLAGLISNKKETTTQYPPILGKIPGVSLFFRNKDETNDQIELLISLTPRIKKLSTQETFYQSNEMTPPVRQIVKAADNAISEPVSLPAQSLALQEYGALIQRAIVDTIVVPKEGLDAKLVVALSIEPDGSIKNIALKEASGNKAVDDAVIEAVKRQSPFPAFPPQLKQEEISLDIPIVFEKSRQG